MSKRTIGQEIIQGLEEINAWKRGKLKLKTYSVEMPKAADVPAIRRELGLSQPEFAGFMGVSLGTLRNWEQARREPQGPARALLLVASKQPGAVRAAFDAAKPVARTRANRQGGRVMARARTKAA
ncbi:MAG: transcriptional regulator [Pseudomonadota bacterium]